ncbi:hypothetical protein WDW89_24020 [Deltaproteobacteria bacterium TL4]
MKCRLSVFLCMVMITGCSSGQVNVHVGSQSQRHAATPTNPQLRIKALNAQQELYQERVQEIKLRNEILLHFIKKHTKNEQETYEALNNAHDESQACQSNLDAEINKLQELSEERLPTLAIQDRWGSSLQWHEASRVFYSLGANKKDDTCEQPEIRKYEDIPPAAEMP